MGRARFDFCNIILLSQIGLKLCSQDDIPTLKLKTERDIAMDFAQKVYQKFDKLIKAVVLFGSVNKHTNVVGSDIDLIVVV